MAKIAFPFYSEAKLIHVTQWGRVDLKPFQILLFVSITERGHSSLPPGVPVLPALLDTGNSLCFTLNEEQLIAAKPWGMSFPRVHKGYSIREFGGRVYTAERLLADVWIHDRRHTELDDQSGTSPWGQRAPIKLALAQEGIACVVSAAERGTRPGGSWATRAVRAVSRAFQPWRRDPARDAGDSPGSDLVIDRQRSSTTARLSLPHLPLLGLRALCLNSLRLEIACNPSGGRLTIDDTDRSRDPASF